MTWPQFDGTVIFTGNKDTTMALLFFSLTGALLMAHHNREDRTQYLISFAVGLVCFACIYAVGAIAVGAWA